MVETEASVANPSGVADEESNKEEAAAKDETTVLNDQICSEQMPTTESKVGEEEAIELDDNEQSKNPESESAEADGQLRLFEEISADSPSKNTIKKGQVSKPVELTIKTPQEVCASDMNESGNVAEHVSDPEDVSNTLQSKQEPVPFDERSLPGDSVGSSKTTNTTKTSSSDEKTVYNVEEFIAGIEMNDAHHANMLKVLVMELGCSWCEADKLLAKVKHGAGIEGTTLEEKDMLVQLARQQYLGSSPEPKTPNTLASTDTYTSNFADDSSLETAGPKNANSKTGVTKSFLEGVCVTFENLSCSNKKIPNSLTEISGCFRPGQLTAVFGPPQNGKRTLDILAGRQQKRKGIYGQVFYNGTELPPDLPRHSAEYVSRSTSGIVDNMSVERMLHYTADLQLPSNNIASQKRSRVEDVLTLLHLEDCRRTRIAACSSSEVKRLQIGLAMITDPKVLFLDEPFLGLNDHYAEEFIRTLRELARDGNRTIVCTIQEAPTGHAFSLFDHLYMIQSGRTVYDGPVQHVQKYFESNGFRRDTNASLPEWLVDITRKEAHKGISSNVKGDLEEAQNDTTSSSHALAELFQASSLKVHVGVSRRGILELYRTSRRLHTATPSHSTNQPHPSPLHNLWTLLSYRSFACSKLGSWLVARFMDKIVFGLLIRILFWKAGVEEDAQSFFTIISLLYFAVVVCGFGGYMAVSTLYLERPVVYRETADGWYGLGTYFVAKWLEEAIVGIFSSATFSALVYFGLNLPGDEYIFFLTNYMTTMIGVYAAFACSALCPSIHTAQAIFSVFLMLQLFFGGVFLAMDQIPEELEWVPYLSFLRYSWTALLWNTYPDATALIANGSMAGSLLDSYGFHSYGLYILNNRDHTLYILAGILSFVSLIAGLAVSFVRHELKK